MNMKMSFLLAVVLAVLLSGCAQSESARINLLPRRVYHLTTAGEPAGNICWMMPFESYRTSMEYDGYINVYDSRCEGWMVR